MTRRRRFRLSGSERQHALTAERSAAWAEEMARQADRSMREGKCNRALDRIVAGWRAFGQASAEVRHTSPGDEARGRVNEASEALVDAGLLFKRICRCGPRRKD